MMKQPNGRARARAAVVVTGLCLVFAVSGCGDGNLVFPGNVATASTTPATPTDTPATSIATPTETPTETPIGTACGQSGTDCTVGGQCCSGRCISPDGVTSMCQ